MNISEELVRELQKRVDVSYEEAEYTLRKTRGDVNLAAYIIMRRKNSGWKRFKSSFHDIFSQLIRYRLILTRKGKVLVDLPLILLVILVLIDGVYRHLFPLFVIFLTTLIFECEVRIEKTADEEGNEAERPGTYQQDAQKERPNAAAATQPVKEIQPIKEQQPVVVEKAVDSPKKDQNDDDYFEIVIEE